MPQDSDREVSLSLADDIASLCREEDSPETWLELVHGFLPSDPEVEHFNKGFVAQLQEVQRGRGRKPEPVDDECYAVFLNMTDRQLDIVTKLLLRGFADAFNAIGHHHSRPAETYLAFLDALLMMVACGHLCFPEPTQVGFCLVEGPPPSEQLERAIHARVLALHDRLMDLLEEVEEGD